MLRQNAPYVLSWMNTSPSQSQLLLAGIVGVGAAVSSLLFSRRDGKLSEWLNSFVSGWGEPTDGVGAVPLVAGLQNLGNNCFLNSVLQALASCGYFRSFLEGIVEEHNLLEDEKSEDFPLAVSLSLIVGELSLLRDKRFVVSPRRLMLALSTYVSSFSLTSQQDAAEALLHLLSSLKEELSQNYVPEHNSLTEITVLSNGQNSNFKIVRDGKEWERWQRSLFGPFCGTIGSTLTCNACSVELFMEYEHFYSLPLSPLLDESGLIIDGCTLEKCLDKFTETELIDHYICNRCWHNKGIKYLLGSGEENVEKIEKLKYCRNMDSCDCKKLLLDEVTAWPIIYSCAFKKLHLGRSPDILCIHLQRSSMSELGNLVKLKGHILFPFILNMSPFISTTENKGNNFVRKTRELKLPFSQPWADSHFSYCDKQLNKVNGFVGTDVALETEFIKLRHLTPIESEGSGVVLDSLPAEKILVKPQPPQKSCIYRLASVVEHYGNVGSGHYAVYRHVKIDSSPEDPNADHCWYYISDGEVSVVSEDDVLASEASLLFYERIEG